MKSHSDSSSAGGSEGTESASNYDCSDSWDGFEDDQSPIRCLLCSADEFHSVAKCLSHMIDDHGFDFVDFRSSSGLDFYGCIKVINYLRSSASLDPSIPVQEYLTENLSAILSDETLMRPAMTDDRFLCEFDDIIEEGSEVSTAEKILNSLSISENVEDLQSKYLQLLKDFHEYKAAIQRNFMAQNDLSPVELKSEAALCRTEGHESKDELDYYFNSYSFADIHESMLKDRVRTDSYRDFIYGNKHLFADKVVLDVGCGTGILSMFAAKAGAKKVYAVDNSHMIDKAREIVRANALDGVVECIRGKIEQVQLPEQVDIIVSEWMGYCLLYEGMLDSVLAARDRWLKPGGFLAPSHASIHLAAIDDAEWMNDRVAFWDDVYGFDMACMKHFMDDQVIVDFAERGCIATLPCALKVIDCNRVTVGQLDFEVEFQLTASRQANIYSFLLWFDIEFNHENDERVLPVKFTTSPDSTQTHWKQCILLVKQPFEVDEGSLIVGRIAIRKGSQNHRELELDLTYSHDCDGNNYSIIQHYKLN